MSTFGTAATDDRYNHASNSGTCFIAFAGIVLASLVISTAKSDIVVWRCVSVRRLFETLEVYMM